MGKRFLVTGGYGFIGSHLVDFLIQTGNSVVIVDDLSSGARSNVGEVNLVEKCYEVKVEQLTLDDVGVFDCVFHLAAQASVPVSVNNFFESSSTNLLSTLNIVDFCAKNQIPIVYASSSAVYGNLPLGDENGGVDLISPYAVDKFLSEHYCMMANRLYGLRSYGLRFFNVYGPRQDPSNPYSGVVSIFANRILKGESITINGGYQTRDFIYIKDIVLGLWSAYKYILNNKVSTYSNLLTGNAITVNELADTLMSLSGNTVGKQYQKLASSDPEVSLGSCQRMHEQLNITQFVKLDEGLSRVLTWMKGNL